MRQRVVEAERICGHHFSNEDLVVHALTHPSAAEGKSHAYSYERLEFLGDSVLGGIIALELFLRFPEMDEGMLTQAKISLVSGKMLSSVAEDLGLAPLILMGESERGTGARGMHSALENVYEALVGALFLDAGYDAAHDFVMGSLGPKISPALAERPISPKSRLQEITQREWRCGPEYKLVEERGPAHDPTFTSVVLVEGRRIGRGTGSSKKSSESAAAIDALVRLGYAEEGDFTGAGITN